MGKQQTKFYKVLSIMIQWYLCYFQHILQSHPGIVFIGGFFYSRYASNTQIKFYLWYGHWSYDLNDTCLTKIGSQNLILCVFIELKVFSVKSFFLFSPASTSLSSLNYLHIYRHLITLLHMSGGYIWHTNTSN